MSRHSTRTLLLLGLAAGPVAAMHASPGVRWGCTLFGLLCGALLVLSWISEIAGLARPGPRPRPMERRARRLLLGASLLTCYLAIEGGAALVVALPEWGEPLRTFRARYLFESPPLLVAHPFLILTNNPAREGTNEQGFLGPGYAISKPPGTFRIACLGGSTTQDGYVKLLREILARRFPERSIEVLNFGNPAWTTTQILINYLLNVRPTSPDLLVVLTGANEIKVRGYPEFRSDYSHAFGVLTRPPPRFDAPLVAGFNGYALIKWLAWSRAGRPPTIELTDVIQRPGGLSQPLRREELAPMERNLRDLIHAARAEGTDVVLAAEPYSRARLEWGGSKWLEHMEEVGVLIRRVAEEEGVFFLDLDAPITGHEAMFVDPIHLDSKLGVPLKAEIIARALEARLEPLDP